MNLVMRDWARCLPLAGEAPSQPGQQTSGPETFRHRPPPAIFVLPHQDASLTIINDARTRL